MDIHLSERAVRYLNIGISAFILVWAILVQLFVKAKRFNEAPYARVAFGFWIAQWTGFVLIFLLFGKTLDTVLLLAVDIQTSILFGFFLVYFQANDAKLSKVLTYIAAIFILITLWNFLTVEFFPKVWWIFVSEAFSALTLILVAITFIRRYRLSSIPLALVTFCYLALQRPVYTSTFVTGQPQPGWMLALAIGKLFWGLLFYSVFFLTPADDTPLKWMFVPPTAGVSGTEQKYYRFRELVIGIIIGVIGHLVGQYLASSIPHVFGHH